MMKLVSWNCQGAFRRKAGLLKDLRPDIAFIQECEHPDKMATTDALAGFQTRVWFGEHGKKGLAVLAPQAFAWEVEPSYDPSIQWCVPLRLSGPVRINLLAVWTKAHRQKQVSYIGQLYRAVVAYQPFLHEYPTVVAGDFNSNQIWDAERPTTNHTAVVQLLQAAGLVSAYHSWHGIGHGHEPTPTFHLYRQRERGFHLDYCFIPVPWMDQIRDVSIGAYEGWNLVSDHRPLSVTLDPRCFEA